MSRSQVIVSVVVLTATAATLAAIWTGDARWGLTALTVALPVALAYAAIFIRDNL